MSLIKNNREDSKFDAGNFIRISKGKIIFAEVYIPNWLTIVLFDGHMLLGS